MFTKANDKNTIAKSSNHLQSETSQISQPNNIKRKLIKRKQLTSAIKTKFANIFSGDARTSIKNFKVDVKLKKDVSPIFHCAYQMPFALKPKVEAELSKMINDRILTKVNYNRWASSIVFVPKKNCNDIRICVDFKKTLNTVIDSDHCVLPEEIYANLSGSRYFTVIDFKGRYQQLEIGGGF